MMQIQGFWYPKESAAQHSATLNIQEDHYTLVVADRIRVRGLFANLSADERLGSISRRITLEDGSVFTSDSHELIQKLFSKQKKANHILHTLESKLSAVLLSIFILIGSIYIFTKHGIPYFSEKIAYALPLETNKLLSDQTMEVLDKYLFKPSKISKSKQKEIEEHFTNTLLPILPEKENFSYHLNFRLLEDRNMSLPNAMALPSGEIVLTDKFVELCETNDELDSILLHEVGHVVHRDSMKAMIEGTFISVVVMVALGDLNGFADMGVGLGSMLVNMHYSRDHESHADHFAFNEMVQNNIDPIAFATIMQKMQDYIEKELHEDQEGSLNEYFSTHPLTKQRIEEAKLYSECFRNSTIPSKCLDISKNP